MRVNSEYLGTARLLTSNTAVAGSMGTIRIVYRAGRYGIDDRGSFCIAWRSISDMQTPQFDRPTEAGYTSVTSTGKIRFRLSNMKYIRPYHNSIKIEIYDGYLKENDELEIIFGDTSCGSPGIRMQSFYEREFEFVPLVDACGTGRYERLDSNLNMEILPNQAKLLQIVVPTIVKTGEEFEIALRVLDRYGNIAHDKTGEVSLYIPGIMPGDAIIPNTAVFSPGNTGLVRVPRCKLLKEGIYHFCAIDKTTGEKVTSNACISTIAPETKLFWGDMHGQTRETLGCGRLDDYLVFARDYALLSFTSWQGNDFEISDAAWNDVRTMVRQFNKEGHFLVYLGYEWSGTTNAGGDHNVIFLGDSDTFYPSSNWLVPGKTDPQNNAFPISQLHERFRGRQDVMLTPHIGGRCSNLDFFNGEFIRTIEIHSQHGIFEWFAMEAMKRRLKVGFVATSDDHSGKPGMSYPSISEEEFSASLAIRSGLTGVFADKLTKESIWNALRNRHCYASTLDRLYLETSIGSYIMGDEFSVPPGKQKLKIKAAGNSVIDAIFIYDWEKCLKRIDMMPKLENTLRIRFSGVSQRGRNKQADWVGSIEVSGGKILNVAKCGYTLHSKEPVIESETRISFAARTDGEIKGYVMDMEMYDETAIKVRTTQGNLDFICGELRKAKRIVKEMGGENLMMEIDFANRIPEEETERLRYASFDLEYELDENPGEHAYWVKVLQDDGNAAWSSPIFVEQKNPAEIED
jgi:hypothetical protein